MPTSIVKDGDLWIIKGDTRPIKDVLSAAGAQWHPQRVRWEYSGETLPEAIQAALDGRNVLPPTEPVVIEREPDWSKLTRVLDDMRAVLRDWQTRDEMTAWVHAVNAEARRLDQQWEANIGRKNAQAVAHGLPVEAGGVLLGELTRPDNDAFVQLASGGTVQSVRQLVTDSTTPPGHIRFYSIVVPKSVQTRKKALKALIDADAIGIVQYNTSLTRWLVLWSTGVAEIMNEEEIEIASIERTERMLSAVEGASVLYSASTRVSRGKLLRLKPSGKWLVELENGTQVSEWDKAMIVLPPSKGTNTEMWWIDEDDTIFRDDDPEPDHFAVLRGPFGSRAEAEKILEHPVGEKV